MPSISVGVYRGKLTALAALAVVAVAGWSIFNRQISANAVPFQAVNASQSQVTINLASNGGTKINGQDVASIVQDRPAGQRITYIATEASGSYLDHLYVVINLPAPITLDKIRLNAIGAYGVGASNYQLTSPTQITYSVLGLSPQAIYTIQADFPPQYFSLPINQTVGPWLESLPLTIWLAIGFLCPLLALLLLTLLVRNATSQWRHELAQAKDLRDSPPDNLPPALAGVVVGGKMSARMLAATLIDLAQRDYLVIANHGNTFTFGKHHSYSGAEGGNLAPFETKLLDKIFLPKAIKSTEGDIQVRLGRHLFSRKIAEVYLKVYDTLTQTGYFRDNPSDIWARYRTIGTTIFFIALVGFTLTVAFMSDPKYPLFSWLGLMVSGLLMMQGAPMLPRRTAKGMLAFRQWTAFRNFLKTPQPFPATVDQTLYSRYLAYAIALGVEVEWTRRFVGNVFEPPPWLITPGDYLKIDDFAAQLFPIVGYVATEMAAIRDPNS